MEVEPAVLGMDLDHSHNDRNWWLESNTIKGFDGNAIACALPMNANTTVTGGTFDNGGVDVKIREVNWLKQWDLMVVNFDDNNMDPLPTDLATPWRTILMQGNIQFNNPNNNIVMDPQKHLTNPAQDAFGLLDGDFKMPCYHLLPDDIVLNFGPFNNSKVYFDQQHADSIIATTATKYPLGMDPNDLWPEEYTPDQYLNKTNQELQTQYGGSFGGVLLPITAVSHPKIIGGKVIGSTINIDELVQEGSVFQVFPNPSNTSISILSDDVIQEVQLFTMTGQQVLQTRQVNGIDVSTLAPGIYLIQATSDKGTSTQRLVVQ